MGEVAGLRREMRHRFHQFSIMLIAVFLVSCASAVPQARSGEYVFSWQLVSGETFTKIDQRSVQAGLVMVSDTAEPGAAPNLPDEALARLGESLQRDLGRAIPVVITEIISADHIKPQPQGAWAQFAELGQQQGFDYLAVVVVSSTEQEYPVTLFLGLTTHAQPGFRRDNWSLLEFALSDLQHHQILAKAEGRGWATPGSSERARD